MSEYTPDDEDVEETYVAYEYAFSAEKDPRGNYRRWLAAHDQDLRGQIARSIEAHIDDDGTDEWFAAIELATCIARGEVSL